MGNYQPVMTAKMTSERKASMEIIPDAAADHVFVATTRSSWFSPGSWSAGTVPGLGSRVHIPFGTWCDFDGMMDEPIFGGCVDGTLNFVPTVNTKMWAQFMCICTSDDLVSEIGQLYIGQNGTPIQPNVQAQWLIADRGVRDAAQQASDPFDNLGAFMSHAATDIWGSVKTPWVVPTAPMMAGAITISVPAPQGWNPQEEVMIKGIHPGQTEWNQIVAISADGLTITLLNKLVYDHSHGDHLGHVGNLTRNVLFTSENTTDITRRGHFMQMHRTSAEIHYAQFKHLGRTNALAMHTVPQVVNGMLVAGTDANTIGRYGGIHFHGRSASDYSLTPAHADGCVMMGLPGNLMPKHAGVRHGMIADFTNCIAAWGQGSGLFDENGIEQGQSRKNLIASFYGDVNAGIDTRRGAITPVIIPNDVGFQGFGIWSSPLVEYTDNVIGDCNTGHFPWPVAQQGDTSSTEYQTGVKVGQENPPASFGYERPPQASPQIWPFPNIVGGGATPDPTMYSIQSLAFYVARESIVGCKLQAVGCYQFGVTNPMFVDMDILLCTDGIQPAYTRSLTIKGGRIRGKDATVKGYLASGFGVRPGNQVTDNLTLDSVNIESYVVGWQPPAQGDNKAINSTFNNARDILIPITKGSVTLTSLTFSSAIPPTTSSAAKQSQIELLDAIPNNGLDTVNYALAPFRAIIDGKDMIHTVRLAETIPFPVPVPAWITGSNNWNPALAGESNAQMVAGQGVQMCGYQMLSQTLMPHPNITLGGGIGTVGPLLGPPPPVMIPVAAFSAMPVMGQVPLTVQFTDQSTNMPTSWMWDFGDGSTSTMQNTSHVYGTPGTYTVSLTATNASGSNKTTKMNLIVAAVQMTMVPDVVTGLNSAESAAFAQAMQTAKGAGLSISLPATHVYTQSPGVGTSAPVGSMITVN